MAHEIHYTSAPRGLRPGHSGLCTVAATEGIPRPLWDRLEALSGYRHFREAGHPDNPVAFAHWIITLGGRSHHVLSRICDAGFDYTRRNNVFAHHLVLEPDELAAAGPAWMLLHPGVMAEKWDGAVGLLTAGRPLPAGDIFPIRCAVWEQAAGDAGWAGVLAETVARKPPRPACIIYPPGADVLALIDEAIRLLPAPLRWEATFNTFFTSLPTGAACSWRCCLAGTHAAEIAVRWAAAGGLIIDLCSADRPAPADSPWVEAARSGTPVALAVEKQTVIEWNAGRSAPAASRATAAPTGATSPAVRPDGAGSAPVSPGTRPRRRRAEAPPAATSPPPARAPWRRVALPYLLACTAIGTGTLLVMYWSRALAPPSTPAPSESIARRTVPDVVAPPPGTAPPATTELRQTPAAQTTAQEPTTRRTPDDTSLSPPSAPPQPPPLNLVLEHRPIWPGAGAALRDRTEVIPLPSGEARVWAAVTCLALALPDGGRQYAYRGGDAAGVLMVSTDGAPRRAAFRVHWKDDALPASPTEILTVALDSDRACLELTWRSATMMRRPEPAAVAYWLLQGCGLLAGEADAQRTHRIGFAPLRLDAVNLLAARAALQPPCDIPAGARVEIDGLSDSWRVEEKRRAAARGTTGAGEPWLTLELNRLQDGRPTDLTVNLRLSPGLRAVESDLGPQVETYRAALKTAQDELAKVDGAIRRLVVDAETDMKHNERLFPDPEELKTANATRSALLAEQRKPLDARRAELQELLRGYHATLSAYDELKSLTMAVSLPDGPRVLLVPLESK